MDDGTDNSQVVYIAEKREASVLVIDVEAAKLLSDKEQDRLAVELEDLLSRYRIAAVRAHFEFAEPGTAES